MIALLFIAIIFTGCQKEIQTPGTDQIELANKIKIFSACRLLSWNGLDDGYARTLHYNNKGLMDSWDELAPLYDSHYYFSIEYDRLNRVEKVKFYDHDVLLYTVVPVYKWGRITEELWYVEDTPTLDDRVVNTYNAIGRIVKRESLNYGYYCGFKYDIIGNSTLSIIKDSYDGTVYDSTILAFKKPVIEPMIAAPGMPYPIPFTNYVIDKLKYSYLVSYDPDENGNLVKTYEHDAVRSVLKAFPNHYAAYYDTYDLLSGLENRQVWHYQNCGYGGNENDASISTTPSAGSFTSRSIVKSKPMVFSTRPEMKEKIIQLRKQKQNYQELNPMEPANI